MIKLSIVINTKNSASTIKKTLESVKFADEIVVVDMNSVDDTLKIVKEYTNKIYKHQDIGFVEPARNYAISKATHDWIFLIDADEVISTGLQQNIKRILKLENPADIYLIPRQNIIFQRKMKHTGWWPDYQPRFFKKDQIKWPNKIHQQPVLNGEVKKIPDTASTAIIHENYADVSSYIERLNRYTFIQAKDELEGFAENVNASNMLTSFFDEFFKRFFVLSGYKDQVVGVGLSLLQSTYELVVKLKIWELQEHPKSEQNTEQIISSLETIRTHFNYWLADWRVKNSTGIVKLFWKARRKFRI